MISLTFSVLSNIAQSSGNLGVSWCCGNYCLLAFVLWCGYCSVSFQSFVLRHWCPQHQETTGNLVRGCSCSKSGQTLIPGNEARPINPFPLSFFASCFISRAAKTGLSLLRNQPETLAAQVISDVPLLPEIFRWNNSTQKAVFHFNIPSKKIGVTHAHFQYNARKLMSLKSVLL